MPYFSVIMCNYNYGDYIAQSIESVLAQTFRDFELIIVDDGSTDDSRDAICGFTDPRISVILKENGGQASAFNQGFSAAQGRYIAFLDSDDRWKPEKLESVRTIFTELGCKGVYHRLEFLDSQSRPKGVCHPGAGCVDTRIIDAVDLVARGQCLVPGSPTSSLAFDKSVLDRIFPLPESWRICADVRLWFASLHGSVACSSSVLGYYRVHGENTWWNTRDVDQKRQDMLVRAFNELREYLAVNGGSIRLSYLLSPYFVSGLRAKYGAVVASVWRVARRGLVLGSYWLQSQRIMKTREKLLGASVCNVGKAS